MMSGNQSKKSWGGMIGKPYEGEIAMSKHKEYQDEID
tara:strand:+ start:1068 stop:1178 length:111 start_codon:yes stop_codon:yes gene_type:complete